MIDDILYYLLIGGLILAVLLIIPFTRGLVAWAINTLLTPSVLKTLQVAFAWLLWCFTRIYQWHRVYFMHLLTPHNKVFPTIQTTKKRIHIKRT